MAHEYGIADLAEAKAYLADHVLGARLLECCEALIATAPDRTAQDILGSIDTMKLRSSMTLFELAAPQVPAFGQILDRFFDGVRDDATLRILGEGAGAPR